MYCKEQKSYFEIIETRFPNMSLICFMLNKRNALEEGVSLYIFLPRFGDSAEGFPTLSSNFWDFRRTGNH